MRRRWTSLAALTALALGSGPVASGQQGAVQKRKKADGTAWRMAHHSFEKTLTYDDELGEWFANAATMALRDRVQLLPPVPDRHGILWHKRAVQTRDFEVAFTLSFYENKGPQDSALVFWISPQNVSEGYDEQAPPGHNYSGLAVVFLGRDKAGLKRQSISGLWNSGQRVISPDVVFAQGSGAQTKDVDWLSPGTQVKFRIRPDGSVVGSVLILDIFGHLAGSVWGWASNGATVDGQLTFQSDLKVRWNGGEPQGSWHVEPGNRLKLEFGGNSYMLHLEGSHSAVSDVSVHGAYPTMLYGGEANVGAEEWTELFRLPAGTLPGSLERCFVGFTGWSGSQTYIEANLHRFEMQNYDTRTIGEEDSDLLGESAGEWLKVLEDEKRYVSQASQREAIQRLTKLLSDHVDRYDKLGESLKEDIVRLDARLETLSTAMATGSAVAQAWVAETNRLDPKVVKDHILGVRTVLSKGKEAHDAKLQVVSQAAQELKAAHTGAKLTEEGKQKVQSVLEHSKAVEEHAAKGSTQTNLLLLLMVLSVAGLGLLFLNRMRYYEKKHYI